MATENAATDHDPLCPARRAAPQSCRCGLIAKARADERTAIMARVKQDMTVDRDTWTVLAQSTSTEQIRADERERIAQAIEALEDPGCRRVIGGCDCRRSNAVHEAARIARATP